MLATLEKRALWKWATYQNNTLQDRWERSLKMSGNCTIFECHISMFWGDVRPGSQTQSGICTCKVMCCWSWRDLISFAFQSICHPSWLSALPRQGILFWTRKSNHSLIHSFFHLPFTNLFSASTARFGFSYQGTLLERFVVLVDFTLLRTDRLWRKEENEMNPGMRGHITKETDREWLLR